MKKAMQKHSAKPRRPALRYFGGKWRIAPWIISHFPKHSVYCEPFTGSASVLLQKDRSKIEVVNDIDRRVINFFEILRESPNEFMRLVDLTPFSRSELLKAYTQTGNRIEDARRFFVLCWQSYGSLLKRKTGWTMEKGYRNWKTRVESWNTMDHLLTVADRLKQVQFECDDALAVIKRWDTDHTLFYVDPPYVKNVRGKGWNKEAYEHDIPDSYHTNLANLLHRIKGMAIVSGYDSEIYADLFADWKKYSIQNRTTKTTTIKTEVIWLSPRCYEQGIQQKLELIHQ